MRSFTTAVALLALATCRISAQDTLVVRADNPPVWGDVHLVEELRIGSLGEDERYSFGLVVGIAEGPDGTVWVADRMLGGIRRYSVNGDYLGQVGRRGRGPGEFQYLMDIRTTPSGEVAAWDPINQRVSFIDQEGSIQRDVTVITGGVLGNSQPFEIDVAGQMYIAWLTDRTFWIQVGQDGSVTDTIWYPQSERVGRTNPVRTGAVISPQGHLVVGRNDEFAFTWPLSDGRTVRLVRDVEATAYDPEERAEAQAREEVFAGRWEEAPKRVPREKPIWSEFDVDADGRIWVRRHVPAVRVQESADDRARREEIGNPIRSWAEPVVYEVVDPRGTFLGTVRIPNGIWASSTDKVSLVLSRDDRVWVLEKGDFGEDYVVRYRIVANTP